LVTPRKGVRVFVMNVIRHDTFEIPGRFGLYDCKATDSSTEELMSEIATAKHAIIYLGKWEKVNKRLDVFVGPCGDYVDGDVESYCFGLSFNSREEMIATLGAIPEFGNIPTVTAGQSFIYAKPFCEKVKNLPDETISSD